MTRTLRVLAILGGTFDPIHYGHLRLASDVKDALGLAEVRLIAAGIPPHRLPPAAWLKYGGSVWPCCSESSFRRPLGRYGVKRSTRLCSER